MLVHEQPKQSQQRNIQEIPCQSTKCKSSKLPTHFTIPQETQTKKNAFKDMTNKMKGKKTAEDKQYRKLNKQSKKVKSLQEQYRELEEQIKEVKQMVQLQLQLINHTTSSDNLNDDNSNQQPSSPQYSIQQVQQIQTKQLHSNDLEQKSISPKVNIQKLQQLITTLFSHQQTIQTANSNYLLLSQVNKQQQSQTLFQINSLQDRIRQLRFLLNGKEDLLAYQLATMDSFDSNSDNVIEDDQEDNNKPICVDYHMPKKMTMANHQNMDSQFKLVQRAVVEMGRLRANVQSLEEQLKQIQIQNHNLQQVKKNNGKQNQEEYQYERQNVEKAHNYIISPSLTTRGSPQSAIAKSNHSNVSHTITNSNNNDNLSHNNLQYLPLSTTNYKNSLIYKVAKLNSIQQQKGQQLKTSYKNLLKEYYVQAQRKKQLVSEYEIQRDIYQYKKRQGLLTDSYRNKLLLKGIIQQKDGCQQVQQNEINLENILGELQHSEQHQQQSQKDTCRKKIQVPTPSTIITVRSSLNLQKSQSQQTSPTNYQTISVSQNKNSQQDIHQHQTTTTGLLFNEITNTPQKKQQSNKTNTNTSTNNNPFLKLKLKSTYQHQLKSQIIPSINNQNSPKNNSNQQYTLSRFSQQKNYNNDKENPSTTVKKQTFMPQQKQISNFNFNPSSFNTPTKIRGPSTIKRAQSQTIQKQLTSIKVKN